MAESTFHIEPRIEETLDPVRVLVACRRRMIALGIQSMLERSPLMEFVALAVIPEMVQAHLHRGGVDVLLCAWREYGDYARPTLEAIRQAFPDTKICVLAERAESSIIHDAFLLGATGFITEACNDDQVIDALIAVSQGMIAIETGTARADAAVAEEGIAVRELLTEREQEILTLMAVGLTTKEMANALFLSPKTVETHRSNLMRKLEITSIAEAVLCATRAGLVSKE